MISGGHKTEKLTGRCAQVIVTKILEHRVVNHTELLLLVDQVIHQHHPAEEEYAEGVSQCTHGTKNLEENQNGDGRLGDEAAQYSSPSRHSATS